MVIVALLSVFGLLVFLSVYELRIEAQGAIVAVALELHK